MKRQSLSNGSPRKTDNKPFLFLSKKLPRLLAHKQREAAGKHCLSLTMPGALGQEAPQRQNITHILPLCLEDSLQVFIRGTDGAYPEIIHQHLEHIGGNKGRQAWPEVDVFHPEGKK